MKKVVIGWGRLNPVTAGHELLINKVVAVAKRERAEPRMYLSHTQNAKKDPLQYRDKITMAKKAFGTVIKKSTSRTLIQLMQELQRDGFTDVVMVAGSDRLREYKTLLNKYNGKDYSFDSVKIASAGQRDPDADGATGMSATKLRQAAMQGKFDDYVDGSGKKQLGFKSGLPSALQSRDAKKLYKLVRKGLLIEELDALIIENRNMLDITEDDITDNELQEVVDAYDYDEEFDLESIEEEDLLERAPLTLQQRIKKARVMKRLAPKLARMRAIKKFRMADAKKLQVRARKQAKMIFRKKMAGNKGANYVKLSPSEKINIDRLVATKSSAIEKLAKRLLPKVRKAEIARIRQARQSKNESVEILNNVTEEFLNKSYNDLFNEGPALDRARDSVKQEKQADKVKHDKILDRARMQDATARVRTARNKNQGVSSQTSTRSEELSIKAKNALLFKASKHSLTFEQIKEVYDAGYSSWNNRNSTTAEQWGFARVNIHLASLTDKKTVKEAKMSSKESLSEWEHKDSIKIAEMLIKEYGEPDEVTETMLKWNKLGDFGSGEQETFIVDESIPHDFPEPHRDFLYTVKKIKVPAELLDTLGYVTGSIIYDGLKETVTARCGSLNANALTLGFVEDIVKGKVSSNNAAAKKEYAKRIMEGPFPGWYTDKLKKYMPEDYQEHMCGCLNTENFIDGKNPERKGLAKRSGVDTKASISKLRKVAKNSTGEKRRMAHWLANMKSGKKKK